MGRITFILFVVVIASIFSKPAQADSKPQIGFFYSYESDGPNYISGFGGEITFTDPESHFGFNLNTAFNWAEVIAHDGYLENYNAWEGGFKVGYFSKISVYAEAGIDLSELIFHDWRYDDYYGYEHYHSHEDDIDSYVGFGAGFRAGPIKLEGFSRAREIDSEYWEARSDWFSGVRISLSF